jgi:hypothetical protein
MIKKLKNLQKSAKNPKKAPKIPQKKTPQNTQKLFKKP